MFDLRISLTPILWLIFKQNCMTVWLLAFIRTTAGLQLCRNRAVVRRVNNCIQERWMALLVLSCRANIKWSNACSKFVRRLIGTCDSGSLLHAGKRVWNEESEALQCAFNDHTKKKDIERANKPRPVSTIRTSKGITRDKRFPSKLCNSYWRRAEYKKTRKIQKLNTISRFTRLCPEIPSKVRANVFTSDVLLSPKTILRQR